MAFSSFTSPRLRGEVGPPQRSAGGTGEGNPGALRQLPLTRLASLATLSPQAGRGKKVSSMTLRSDHVAGAAFILFGLTVFAFSGDLPFGSLSSPGAGMMPKLVIGLMLLFGLALILGAAKSQLFAEIDWSDGGHALQVVVIAAAAIASYQTLGFIVTMTLLVFVLLVVIERKPVHYAGVYAIALTGMAWWVFGKALKAPLETGILGF